MVSISRIVTHSGPFHADDVLAVSVLLDLSPQAEVLRTRDRELLAAALADTSSVLVDVGWAYDPALRNFDHHQKDFTKVRANGVPYASIGLVWDHFADRWLTDVIGVSDSALRARTKALVDEDFIQSVDAFDCGVVTGALYVRGVETQLRVPSVADLVGSLNPTWEEAPDFDTLFLDAVLLAQRLLRRQAQRALSEVCYGTKVSAADDGTAILVLDEAGPWRRFVRSHHRVVVFPATGEDGWLAQAVGDPASTVFPPPLRIEYPENWRGRAESDLRALTGIDVATFCHRAGFIAGATTRDGAIAIARRLLREQA